MKKNIYITDHFSVQQKLTHYKSTIPQERNNERRKEGRRKKERKSGGGIQVEVEVFIKQPHKDSLW